MTQNFLVWFEWGFILQMIAIVGAILGALGAQSANVAMGGLGLIACAQCIGGLAWLIAGSVLRFRDTGNVCSGDGNYNASFILLPYAPVQGILTYSGQFMKVWLITFYCFFGCICCTVALGVVFGKKNN